MRVIAQDDSFTGRSGTLVVHVTVTNTGNVTSDEVVFCYVKFSLVRMAVHSGLQLPIKEVKGFERLHDVRPGQSVNVTFDLNQHDLATRYSSAANARVDLSGAYEIFVGGNVDEAGARSESFVSAV